MTHEKMENKLNTVEHNLDRLSDSGVRLAEDQHRLDETQQNAWRAIETLAR